VDAFEKQKAMQIAITWVNTAAGIAGAWSQGIAQLGPIAGSIVAAIASAGVLATAGTQTGFILQQQHPAAPIPKALPTPPKFALGGIIDGSSYAGDNLDIKANSGEMILNRDQQINLFEAIKSGNLGTGGGNSNISVNVYCYMDSSDFPIKQKLIEIQRDEAFRK